MGSVMVRYKVKAGRAEENESYIKAVFAQLAAEQPHGLRYASFKLADGLSFAHIVYGSDSQGAGKVLNELATFKAFTAEIADRCDELPVSTEMTEVGSYGF